MDEERVAARPRAGGWTRVEDYVAALVRQRDSRRRHGERPRSEPEAPRLSLSTLPFLALIAALGVLAAVIIVAAWPGSQPQPKPREAAKEMGKAERGWFDEAKREMR